MSDYAYDDDSDDAVDQDDAPAHTAAPMQDDAGAAADLPDVTGGYDMSTDPLMMDYVLNGTGSWPSGDYDMSNDPLMTDYALNGSGGWPPATDNGSSDAGAAPVSKSVPIVPSDGPGGAPSGPAIVQTLADTAASSGPATYVPIVANTSAGFGSLSDAVGEKSVPVVQRDYAAAAPPPFDASLAGSDDYASQKAAQSDVESDDDTPSLINPYTGEPYPDGVHSRGGWLVDGKGNAVDEQTGRALEYASNGGPDLSAAMRRPEPTDPDALAAKLVARNPDGVPAGFRIDPSTGLITRFDPTAARFSLVGTQQPVWRPVTPEEQQWVLEDMLHASSYKSGAMSQQEIDGRAALMPQEKSRVADAQYVNNPNVRAFLDTVSWAEGTTENGYNTLFGTNRRAHDLSTFPGYDNPGSTASGRYQVMRKQWEDVGQKKLGLTDFSPMSQELIAIEQMRQMGILDQVAKGDVANSLGQASRIWAALPVGSGKDERSRYNQPYKRYADVLNTFRSYQ